MSKKQRKKYIDDAIAISKNFENPDLTKHLYADENGEFKSDLDLPEGHISMAFVQELILWVYTHPEISKEEKLERILSAESINHDICKGMGINFIPNWSKKVKSEMNDSK
jgi:hypothetical protein